MPEVKINDIVLGPSLFRSLEGVLVATKVSATEAEPVKNWIQKYAEKGLTFDKWHSGITDKIFGANSESQQSLASLVLGITLLRQRSREQSDRQGACCNLSSEELDTIWRLVARALTNIPTVPVTRSSQGFFAIPLCSLIKDKCIDELFRLHVWLPDGKRGLADTAVHSHQPYARSWILGGEGTNSTYKTQDTSDISKATHAKYTLGWSAGDGSPPSTTYSPHHTGSVIFNTHELIRIRENDKQLHRAGDTYAVPAGDFHKSGVPPDAYHATLFFFDSKKGFIKSAPVLGPVDGTEYSASKEAPGRTAAELARCVEGIREYEAGVQQ